MQWNNYKVEGTGMDIYGNERLALAVYFRDNVISNLSQPIFIENGTLLGAWRNQKFIKHDDDFDFGILIDNLDEIGYILKTIKDKLSENYECRHVNVFTEKIEIYEPKFGHFQLEGPNYRKEFFHYVTCDLQFYLKQDNGVYRCLYYVRDSNQKIIDRSIIEPLGEILLEGEIFPCPNNVEELLKIEYGYIGLNAEFCQETQSYKEKTST
jgi:phosphorylcholine metabolism protein LicD